MIKMMQSDIRKKLNYCLLLSIALLTACSESTDKKPTIAATQRISGMVQLAPNSPKKAYIKTTKLSLTQHPLMEPLTGKVTYNENVTSRISSPVAGRVVSAPLPLGSVVETGSNLLELDSPDVANAESDFAKAQADLILTKKNFIRQQELFAGKATSQKELERSQDEFNATNSELERAKDRLKNLHIDANQNDGRFKLRSPIAGIIVEKDVTLGLEVRPDRESPLFVISDTKKLTLQLAIFEVNLSKIKVGQTLSITVPAYPNKSFPATIQYIGQVLDEKTRSIQVRCDLPNSEGLLLPGMYATINVNSDPTDKAIVIPLTAVFTEGDSDYVFIALDEDNYQQREVDINLRLKDKAIVSQGLQENELLVSEGALTLRSEEETEPSNEKQ